MTSSKSSKNNKCIYEFIEEEVKRQRDIWGEQNHPDVLNRSLEAYYQAKVCEWQEENGYRAGRGECAWDGILLEEVYEALAESDPEKLKTELVQAAAVIVSWLNCIERREQEK